MEPKPDDVSGKSAHWTLLRDVFVLQVKLFVDGFRDLMLVPASLLAALVSLARTREGKPGAQFYRVLAVGKQSESWINLFGALKNAPKSVSDGKWPEDSRSADGQTGDAQITPRDLDELITRVESYVVDEYQRGGVTKQAKKRIDAALDALQKRGRRFGGS